MTSERATSDDDQNLIHALEHDAEVHDAAAERLEDDARHRRRAAERARKGAQYIRAVKRTADA